jgi:conjugal transfer pilus assembly protein TraA
VLVKKILLLVSMFALPALAFAASGNLADQQAAFVEMNKTLIDWMTGPLGSALGVTMLVMGGAIGIAKNSPMPAVTGVAGAAFLHWAPAIIMGIMVPQGDVQEASNTASVVVASSANAASAQPASQPSTARTATSASAPVVASAAVGASIVPADLKYLAEKPAASATVASHPVVTPAVVAQGASQPVTSHSASLPRTVPIPAATQSAHQVSTKSVSSTDLTKWLGLAGFAVILSLLALLVYLTTHRKAKDRGFTPSAPSGAGSVFTDPHGFVRRKSTR